MGRPAGPGGNRRCDLETSLYKAYTNARKIEAFTKERCIGAVPRWRFSSFHLIAWEQVGYTRNEKSNGELLAEWVMMRERIAQRGSR